MFNCPHCEKPGISPLRKVILSPGIQTTCRACGGSSSTRYLSWLAAMLPGTALMVAALFVDSDLVEWSLSLLGLLMMIILPFWFTPLHRE